MKPHKKSIKDFFASTARNPKATSTATTNPSTASAASTADSSVRNTQKPLEHVVGDPSTAPSAPAASRAPSVEAHPPGASQTSAYSGASKRIVANGEHVVLNSDSDDDSLPDLDWGEPPTSSKLTTTAKETTITTRSKRISDDENEDEGLRRPTKKVKSGKRSLNALVESAQRNAETERRIREHKADLERSSEEPTTNDIIDESVLGQVAQNGDDDPEQAHRLFLAMQRTNATQMESAFYFFEDISDSIPVQTRFPASSLPKSRWASNFEDSVRRDQAFMSGFAHQIFRIQALPEELASWMLEQICTGRNETLDTKYLEILESHTEHFKTLLDTMRLTTIFKAIGANVKSLTSNATLEPTSETQSTTKTPLPSPLKSIARLLQRAAPWLSTETRSHALHLLCCVCLDDRVIADAEVLDLIGDAMEAIICYFADNTRLISGLTNVIPQLLSQIQHPILQRNLICALHARSPLTAYLQRHMALSFLLYPKVLNLPLADSNIPDIIHKHLDASPHFQINKRTDFGHLTARLTLLDVALGPGLLSVPYQPLISPTPSAAGSSPITAPIPDTSELKDFNATIDGLAHHVKFLGNSIVEAGAVVDLSILEAKDSMERLCARLEYAVRIGGKKIHNPFGGDEDEAKQLRVSKFFFKSRKPATPAPIRGIFDDEDDFSGVDSTRK